MPSAGRGLSQEEPAERERLQGVLQAAHAGPGIGTRGTSEPVTQQRSVAR